MQEDREQLMSDTEINDRLAQLQQDFQERVSDAFDELHESDPETYALVLAEAACRPQKVDSDTVEADHILISLASCSSMLRKASPLKKLWLVIGQSRNCWRRILFNEYQSLCWLYEPSLSAA